MKEELLEIKSEIAERKSSLKELFLNSKKGKNFLVRYTKFYDEIISKIYKMVLEEMFNDYLPMRNSIPVVVVALGSYGREELNIHSDIDLMISYKKIAGYNSEEIIEKFVYSLWDAGLKLGHRVHEISELEEVAKSDITIKTALIEGRKVIGSSFIWGTVEQKLNYIRDTNQEDFFKEKLLERDGRYKRYPFDSMTPNLKEGVGGFRDANLLFWILNVKFKTTSIREFSGELFSEEEFRKFSIALDLLFSVRTYLHFSLKKKRDKVVLEDVPYLSELFSQNQFQTLQKILSAMKVVHLFTARVIEKVLEIRELEYLNFEEKFDLHKIFKKENAFPTILNLWRNGTLQNHIPLFEKVYLLPQFDGYHYHTVDVHSLYTVRELEKIEDKFLKGLFETLSSKEREILKIASLFHDIGKGRVEDHSRVGAKVTKSFLQKNEFPEDIIEKVSHLIRNHTLMTDIAYHEDIHNEKVIFSFLSKVQDEQTVKLLYILTYADVKSVGAETYNSYNKALLFKLYQNSLLVLNNSEMIRESKKREKVEKQIKNLEAPKPLKRAIFRIKSNQLFFKLDSLSILKLSKRAKELENFSFEVLNTPFLSVRILRRENLNFDIAYFLNKVDFLSVISLDIFELFDGIKYFQIDFQNSVEEGDVEFVKFIIEDSFSETRKVFKKIVPKIGGDEVKFDCEYTQHYLKLSLNTENQNGLLAYLFKFFEDENLKVVSSKTQTFKVKVRDMFLIEKDRDCNLYRELFDKML
jgi:[protein-PII] uridylyltransferase